MKGKEATSLYHQQCFLRWLSGHGDSQRRPNIRSYHRNSIVAMSNKVISSSRISSQLHAIVLTSYLYISTIRQSTFFVRSWYPGTPLPRNLMVGSHDNNGLTVCFFFENDLSSTRWAFSKIDSSLLVSLRKPKIMKRTVRGYDRPCSAG